MLPLLINQLAPASPLQAGIAVGRRQLCAVTIESKGSGWSVRNIHRQDLAVPLFSGAPTTAALGALDAALQAISRELDAQFALIHVALPDSVIRSSVFELDELPKAAAQRTDLMRWRFAQSWQRPEESLECRGQDLGNADGKRLLLAQAGDRAWSDCVKQALERAGQMPASMNAALAYRYNRFQHQFAPAAGAMLSLDPDGWTLAYWDEVRRLRHITTRLRAGDSSDELGGLADDVVRNVQSGAIGKAERLYLSGDSQEMLDLSARLEGKLGIPVTRLHAVDDVAGNTAWAREGMAPLALAAAMSS
ncbi:MAG TPA: hypothetical protein VIU93_11525 [Gallionellaceae bacterium]